MATIQNPFINYHNVINYTDNNNNNIILTCDNITKYYSDIYIIIKKNENLISSDFYNNIIDKDIFDKESNNLILYKVTNRILNNKNHYNNLVVLSNIFLERYNIFDYKLQEKNLILPIFTISFNNFLSYLKQYDNKNSIEDIIKIKIMNNYFNFHNNLISIITNLNENLYWQNFYNCNLNFTKNFINRMFTFKLDRLDNPSIAIIIKKLIYNSNNKIQNNITNNNKNDYLKEIEINDFNDINTYSLNIFKNYIISNYDNNSLTKENINKLFDISNNNEKILLFSNLLVSKKYCHLVLNNKYILSIMINDILLFGPLFRYLISYAFIRFYIEEIKKNIFIKTTDNNIFDIHTASLLPVYPFSHTYPKLNPYMTLLIDDKYLNLSNNLCGMIDYNSLEIYNKGICNLEEFKYRLNIFCSGDDKMDIFKNIDFNKYNIAITGSTMTACIQKRHPLMSLFKNNNLVSNFNDYFDEYYSKSDVDIMFKTKDIYEYLDNIKLFFNDIKNNLNSFYIHLNNKGICSNEFSTHENIKLVLNKINYLFITEKYIIDNIIIKDYTDSNKIQYIKNNINSSEIIEIFKPIYKNLMSIKLEEHIKKTNNNVNIYNDIFINNDDFKIYIINKSKNNNIYIESSYKYNIISQYLKHPLELFQIKTEDFFGIVSKFHLPCVRAYYDGTNLYMTTLCVISHLTYMNIDYKYMHGNKDPFEILIKNHMRGFGTILTNNEKKLLELYIKEIPYYSFLYKNIFGPIDINSKIYKPSFYNIEYFNNINIIINNNNNNINDTFYMNKYNTFNSLIINNNMNNKNMIINDEIKNRFKSIEIDRINYNNLISISKNGNIIPFQKWVIDYTLYYLIKKNIDN